MTRVTAAAVLLAALLGSGCVAPSRSDGDYARKAANTAEAVVSAVNNARLAVRAVEEKRAFGPYATALLAEAEDDANGAMEALDRVQPPTGRADALHDHLDDLVTPALDVLRRLRVAVRRGELDALPRIAGPLPQLAQQIEDFEEHPR
jgi:hypothetical protein